MRYDAELGYGCQPYNPQKEIEDLKREIQELKRTILMMKLKDQ